VDIPEESITKENVQMTQKPRRIFTDEQKAEAVRIVNQSGKPVSQVVSFYPCLRNASARG
jgi:transposase